MNKVRLRLQTDSKFSHVASMNRTVIKQYRCVLCWNYWFYSKGYGGTPAID